MPTERSFNAKLWIPAIIVAAVIIALLAAWRFVYHDKPSNEILKHAQEVVSTINSQDYQKLEKLITNPVAVETIRKDVGNKQVQLGLLKEESPRDFRFSLKVSNKPEVEIFVFMSKEQSGNWYANVP
ncbi:hypothetical protein [Boudabousia marimammalium]|uniref:DUF3887 domain-containing protein n=1 Tax=Boudabousia marimammalium TaxID=156892 RepID=A0A1Q5PJY8_9ACTO|nr:hypothetical protein [Boudabousia marimammalium]OKL46244.1 hypothetical protein BM477_07385 [Boudabousia marimammalium]